MAKPNRSQFIEKLHDLLEHPYDADNLHWVGDDAFSITVNDAAARRALSAKWEFRSLSSFIRQLSYYGFRRLSDRRRSGERKASSAAYIVFAHPSGFFVRGDPSLLPGIVRKTRNRPSKRRASASSAVSNERSDGSTPPPPIPQWAPPTEYQPQYTDEHNSSLHSYGVVPTFNPSLDSLRTIGDQQAAASAASSVPPITSGTNDTWRAYTPPTWNFSGTSGNLPQQPPGRRTSVSDFKISAPISPRSTNKTELPSPRLRKVPSSISIQNTSSPNYQHQQHEEPLYSPASHRSTPYPTPTFNTYPLPSGLAAPYDPPSIYDSSTSVPPPFGPYNHYSYHSAQATNPLPSPTYSSDGDHNPHHTLQQQHLDPRSLLTAPNSGRSSFSGPSGSATQLGGGAGGGEGGLHYFGQRVPQPPPPPPQSGANLVWSATPRGLMGGSNNYHEQAR